MVKKSSTVAATTRNEGAGLEGGADGISTGATATAAFGVVLAEAAAAAAAACKFRSAGEKYTRSWSRIVTNPN